MNNSEKEALRWYLQGTRDARTAGRNSKNGDFEVACFLYQQAAEKAYRADQPGPPGRELGPHVIG